MEAIGSAPFRSILSDSRACEEKEKHAVGVTYWCSYWQYVYTVVELASDLVTCHSPADSKTWTHSTPLDWRRDRVMLNA